MTSYKSNQSLAGLGWPWINATDPSSVSIAEYRQWYSDHSAMVGPNITDCSLEEEMNKVSLRYNFNLSLFRGYQDKSHNMLHKKLKPETTFRGII